MPLSVVQGRLRVRAEEPQSGAESGGKTGNQSGRRQAGDVAGHNARFGRFPQRNAILGRASTEAEISFLLQPGSSF